MYFCLLSLIVIFNVLFLKYAFPFGSMICTLRVRSKIKSVSKIKYITVIYLLCAHIILSSVKATNHIQDSKLKDNKMLYINYMCTVDSAHIVFNFLLSSFCKKQ